MRDALKRAALETPWDVAAAAYHRIRRTPVLGRLMLRAIDAASGGARWIDSRVYAGPLRGMTLHIDPRVQADVVVGAYERRLSRHVAGILRPGDTAFDVGSHLGYFGILMATVVGAGGSVVCFEPDPGLHHALQENVERNDGLIAAQVSLVHAAVGAARGKTPFETGGHSTRGRLDDAGDVEVDVTTLDDAAAGLGTPRFVKVDVEGGELDALAGARSMIAAQQTSFGIEIHSRALGASCERVLEEAGYECRFVTEVGRAETYLLADPASTSFASAQS